ncbi:MAG: hypothetical protein CVT92_02680 [Bacteroidetes bacterium HGW-Bacteroidetes-1]|jgi:transcriptional regulator with XRE-family HTH domain|nr:MAG: hypothetical protein CVT92_02680 [Bacteroidetes bacterium HGW-Bacteroidetes-1]
MIKDMIKNVEHQTSFDLVIEIAEYIAIYMEEHKLSKPAMAAFLGIHRMYLHQILIGARIPSLNMIVRIAHTMGKKIQIKFIEGKKK